MMIDGALDQRLDSKRQEETHRKTTSQMGRPLPEEHQPSYIGLPRRETWKHERRVVRADSEDGPSKYPTHTHFSCGRLFHLFVKKMVCSNLWREGQKESTTNYLSIDDEDDDGEDEHRSGARQQDVGQQEGQEGQEKEGNEQVLDRQPEGREEGELETSDDDVGEGRVEEREEREGHVLREEEVEKEMEEEEAQEQAVQEERQEQEKEEQEREVLTGENKEQPEEVVQPREEEGNAKHSEKNKYKNNNKSKNKNENDNENKKKKKLEKNENKDLLPMKIDSFSLALKMGLQKTRSPAGLNRATEEKKKVKRRKKVWELEKGLLPLGMEVFSLKKIYREEQKKLKEAAKYEAIARARAQAEAEARAQAQAEAEVLEQVPPSDERIEEVAAVHDASEAGESAPRAEGKGREKRYLAPEEGDEGHPDLEREQEVGQFGSDYECCRQGEFEHRRNDDDDDAPSSSALVANQPRQSSSSSGCGKENDGGSENVEKVNEVVRNGKEGSETALLGCDTLQTSPDQEVLKQSQEVLENEAGEEKYGAQSSQVLRR
ncbi:unnamed protein product [Caenorhabditis auriculariae]|uniref:Uncharacterized protein n=1 Tax=Caenorhabditis auriculariae TaxID=2777116 RepID=A0A8S1HQV6_9PELO|nr:unnamed protein product [Caenorhabditis auriculariae]